MLRHKFMQIASLALSAVSFANKSFEAVRIFSAEWFDWSIRRHPLAATWALPANFMATENCNRLHFNSLRVLVVSVASKALKEKKLQPIQHLGLDGTSSAHPGPRSLLCNTKTKARRNLEVLENSDSGEEGMSIKLIKNMDRFKGLCKRTRMRVNKTDNFPSNPFPHWQSSSVKGKICTGLQGG